MRTVGFLACLVPSLLISSVVIADDNVQLRNQPASPETNDADYAHTKYEGPTVVPVAIAEPSVRPDPATVYLPIVGPWLALDTLSPCNGTQLQCRSKLDNEPLAPVYAHAPQENGNLLATSFAQRPRLETTLHLAPSVDGVGVWRRF